MQSPPIEWEGWKWDSKQILEEYAKSCNKLNYFMHQDLFRRELLKPVNHLDARSSKTQWVLITINPKPDVPLSVLKFTVEQAVALKVFDQSIYAFEQRAEQGEFLGIHCHMLCHRTTTPSIVKREMIRKFRSLVGHVKHIDLKFITDSDVPKVEGYVLGDKKDDHKQAKVDYDKKFRKENGLQDYYISGAYSLVRRQQPEVTQCNSSCNEKRKFKLSLKKNHLE